MGEVYLATMTTFEGVEKQVALKLLRSDLAADEGFVDLFVEEARVVMSLSHANLVQAFDVGRLDDRLFLAMEYVEGVDLDTLLALCRACRGQCLPHHITLLIITEALKGLDYAHRRSDTQGQPLGIVHRDISPSNLLISREGEVKLADFGIAQTRRASHAGNGQIRGKVPYMAPEQLEGAKVDRRADIYAMGTVLYEALTGRRMIAAHDAVDAADAVLNGRFASPREVRPELPERLEQVLLRCVSLEPSDRYPNAAALRQELEELAHARGLMLSTPDLADFLVEVKDVEEPEDGVSSTSDEPEPEPEGDGRGHGEGAFDALLGMELLGMETSEPLNVYRTSEAVVLAPSVGTPRSGRGASPTETHARRSRKAFWLVPLLALVAVGAIALFFSMTGPPSDHGDDGHSTAVSVSDADSSPGEPDTSIGDWNDADSDTASVALSTADAEEDEEEDESAHRSVVPEPSPRPSPGRRHPPEEPPPLVEDLPDAALSINSIPWTEVYVDGTSVRATPLLGYRLSPGVHQITLRDPQGRIRRQIRLTLEPGEHRRLSIDLRGENAPDE